MIYLIFNIILVCITLFLIILSKRKTKFLKFDIDKIVNKYYKFIIAIIFFVMLFSSLYKLGVVPYGMHIDEAGMAYDARLLAKYGVDRYLNKLPLYLINFGGGQSVMYAYLVALLIKLFGYSKLIIRIPAVLLRIVLFISGYFIIKDNKDKLHTIIFLLLLAIMPYFIMQSRWGLDCNLLVGFLTLSTCILLKAINKDNKLLYVLSGILYGLSLYTYALSYLILPIFLLITCIYLIYTKKINLTKLICFGLPIFILAIPLMLMILINKGIIPEINSFITIPKLPEFRSAEISPSIIIRNLAIFLNIVSFDKLSAFGGNLIYNSIPYFGTLYYISIPFLVIGGLTTLKNIYKSFKEKEFNKDSIIMFWFISVMLCMIVIDRPNINKANAVFFPLVYFIYSGIVEVIKKKKELILPIIILYSLNFLAFSNYYFNQYNKDNNEQRFFATSYLDALEYTKKFNDKKIYVEQNITEQDKIFIHLDNFTSIDDYNEEDIIKTNNNITYILNLPENIDEESIYILKDESTLIEELKKLDYQEEVFDNIYVLYK